MPHVAKDRAAVQASQILSLLTMSISSGASTVRGKSCMISLTPDHVGLIGGIDGERKILHDIPRHNLAAIVAAKESNAQGIYGRRWSRVLKITNLVRCLTKTAADQQYASACM